MSPERRWRPAGTRAHLRETSLPALRVTRTALTLLLACVMVPSVAHEVIERVKASVVGVGSIKRTRVPPFRFLGTGFVVEDGKTIVTNAHVIASVLDDSLEQEKLAILLPTSDPLAARAVEVERAAVDDEHDLAVLKLVSGRLPALALRTRDGVSDGDEFLFTGFPIGAVLGPIPITHRAMISAITPITMPAATSDPLDPKVIRRLQRGVFPVYQLDGTAYPGHSGSPLYDPKTGEVVGIINMVLVKGLKETALTQPSGISYAIPVRHLRELLAPR
jgi:serine protease Do